MVTFTRGNILDANVEALVNPVNCVGVMGKGLALQFKNAYPDAFVEYLRACRDGQLEPGRVQVVDIGRPTGPCFIVHFPTKRHWRERARLVDVATGLDALVAEVERRNIRSIAMPALGCGLGGLAWADVRPLIERAFAKVPRVRALVFEPA
jgi:O-acetyl-ADP-ribose deacetylase (regulator of RNase III)